MMLRKIEDNDERISYVIVKIIHKKDSDIHDIMAECDYSFNYEDIIDTEIMGEKEITDPYEVI